MTDKVQVHWLNQQHMAKSLGVTVSALSRWEVEPVARIGKHLYYKARAVLDNRLEQAEQSGSNSDIEVERLRLTRAQAEGQEIKNELAKGKTAPIEIITLVLSKVTGETAGILDSLPLNSGGPDQLDNLMVLLSFDPVVSPAQAARVMGCS